MGMNLVPMCSIHHIYIIYVFGANHKSCIVYRANRNEILRGYITLHYVTTFYIKKTSNVSHDSGCLVNVKCSHIFDRMRSATSSSQVSNEVVPEETISSSVSHKRNSSGEFTC